MAQLITKWGEEFDAGHLFEEHPRPQMRRDRFINLNGLWEYAIEEIASRETQDTFPSKKDGDILVPFSPESHLSGVERHLQPNEYLWYRRHYYHNPGENKLILHFDAVDQICVLYINNKEVTSHVGGYLPFSADITDFLSRGDNTITLRVEDKTDTAFHARGKQKLKPSGMFYTAQSGIWQSVWAEEVPPVSIASLELVPMLSPDRIQIVVHTSDHTPQPVSIRIHRPSICEEADTVPEEVIYRSTETTDSLFSIPIEDTCYWTPEKPWLYHMDVRLDSGDAVGSYFAMRSFSLKTMEGEDFPRVCLNGKPLFQQGVLDQGYWPESLMTPPCDEAMIWDLTEMKRTGYNMVRKHIKIEPERWYYHCDRLGLIVWQDMVNGGGPIKQWFVTYAATPLSIKRVRVSDKMYHLLSRSDKEGQTEFKNEMLATIRLLKNHPSICTWVIFNEGWGQFHTTRLTLLARKADPTRLIDQASGWFDQRGGDFFSVHNYFFDLTVTPEKHRANVLSEIGGIVYRVDGHSQADGTYGYSSSSNRGELNAAYEKLQNKLRELIPQGLCASVYTQWTDIEGEINGVYTYDRKVRKIDGSVIS